jgi:muramoyltetrapeptide carboxypeptidase
VRWDRAGATRDWRGYLAGRDEDRLRELRDAFTEPGVEIVWLARGGSGLGRILEPLVAALRGTPPRLLVGFSDATSLLGALATRLGWITFHGPMVASLARPDITCDLDAMLDVLRGERAEVEFPAGEGPAVAGRLLGGNLTVLASTAGTPSWPCSAETIWFFEDVNESRYRLDRSFAQMRAAGALDDARALWLGDFGLPAEDEAGAREMFVEDARPLPVLGGAPAGHRGTLAALPVGGRVVLDPARGRLTALAPWVRRGGRHV